MFEVVGELPYEGLPVYFKCTFLQTSAATSLYRARSKKGAQRVARRAPSSREGHHSTVGRISGFLVSDLIPYGSHAEATSLVHRNSVPSTQMRCMITANRRARATVIEVLFDDDGNTPDDAHPRHQGGLYLCTARRTRHARAGYDGKDGTRQLPRLRIVDDGGGPLARARGPLRLWLSYVPSRDGPEISAAARPTHGARSICRGPAGSNSIPPTASSETAISSASRSRVILARQFRSPAPMPEVRRTSWG